SHKRYEIATAGAMVEGLFAVAVVLVPIFWVAASVSGSGWGGCGMFLSLVALGVMWLVYMAVADLRILRSVRRARAGQCGVCGYQIDAAPSPGAAAGIATCPECGEEVIAGRAATRDEPTLAPATITEPAAQ